MRWQVHSEEPLYTDRWIDVRVADVELPDGRHLDHRLIRAAPGAGAVVTKDIAAAGTYAGNPARRLSSRD